MDCAVAVRDAEANVVEGMSNENRCSGPFSRRPELIRATRSTLGMARSFEVTDQLRRSIEGENLVLFRVFLFVFIFALM